MDLLLPTRAFALVLCGAFCAPSTLPARWRALDRETAAALAASRDGSLEHQRAGAFEAPAPLGEAERAVLVEAERAAPGLGELRGGDVHFTDREVQIILWTAVVIGIILILA
jgi:hypothetical protein